MHTVIVIVIGLITLGACLLLAHALGGNALLAPAALFFVPLWLIGAGINMYIGVRHAGYSVSEEAPVFLIVFAVPALIALLAWWRLLRH